ncbi:hypothetical protein DWW23_09720 [Parabacteroides sp. AF14-59]|nr:hypothetical protein DWW23_09720 [Parabacteroides sp. AF14-59]
MLHNIKPLYLHCVFHGIRFKVNNEDWLSVKIAFFAFIKLLKSFCEVEYKSSCIFPKTVIYTGIYIMFKFDS